MDYTRAKCPAGQNLTIHRLAASLVFSVASDGVSMSMGTSKSFICPHCNKRFQWTTRIADRKAQCPSCAKRIRIPTVPGRVAEAIDPLPPAEPKRGSEPASDTYDLDLTGIDESVAEPPPTPAQQAAAQTGRCPACNQSINPSAVICIKCGYNLRKGKRLQTTVAEGTDEQTGALPASIAGSALASAAGSGAVSGALADREDDLSDNRLQDIYLPATILAIGLLWRVVRDLMLTDLGFKYMLERTALEAFFILPLICCGSVLIAMMLSTTFGSLSTTLLKLAAIVVAPEIFGDLMEMWLGAGFAWGFPGIFLIAPIYFGMYFGTFTYFFDLDPTEAGIATSMMCIIRFLLHSVFVLFALPYVYEGISRVYHMVFP